MNYQPPTTSYANRLSSPAHPEPVEGSLPVLSVVEGNYWQPATVYILLSNWALAPNPSPLTLVFCPRPFTTVEKPLQIRLFMQNKPKFRKSQMNVNKVLTKDYDKKTLGEHGKNKPNSNPIQSQSNPIKANLPKAQMNVNKVLTKDYENKLNWAICENKANSNPIQTQNKPNQTQFQTAHLLIDRTKSKFLNFLLKNPADTKNPPKNLMPSPYDLPTNKILAFVAATKDNNS